MVAQIFTVISVMRAIWGLILQVQLAVVVIVKAIVLEAPEIEIFVSVLFFFLCSARQSAVSITIYPIANTTTVPSSGITASTAQGSGEPLHHFSGPTSSDR